MTEIKEELEARNRVVFIYANDLLYTEAGRDPKKYRVELTWRYDEVRDMYECAGRGEDYWGRRTAAYCEVPRRHFSSKWDYVKHSCEPAERSVLRSLQRQIQ